MNINFVHCSTTHDCERPELSLQHKSYRPINKGILILIYLREQDCVYGEESTSKLIDKTNFYEVVF